MNRDPCDFCDGIVEASVQRVPFDYRKELIYVDNVPVKKCGQCGELYFDAAVVKRLEAIAERRKTIRTKIAFPLADYRKALALEPR